MGSVQDVVSASSGVLGKLKSSISNQLRNYWRLHAIVFLYIALFSIIALTRHHAFGSSAWDLGIFNQAFYTTVKHGKLFYYTAELYANPGGNIFGVHFSPVLFLIIPFYTLLPRPETLLVVQTVILASGAYPTFLLANHTLKNKSLSLLFSLMYLMYPHLHSVNLFDFHSEAFFIPFALFSIYYFVTEKWSRYFLFLALTFFTKEFASLPFLVLGLVQLWSERKKVVSSLKEKKFQDRKTLISIITVGASILWYVAARGFMSFFNPSPNPGFTQGEPWRILGGNPLDLSILGSATQLDFLRALKFEWDEKLYFLFTILGPLVFLPVTKLSLFLPTLLWFLLSFFSNYPPYYQLGYQYSAYVVPFSIAATIQGVGYLRSVFNIKEKMLIRLVKRFVLVGLLFALALSLMKLPLTNSKLLAISTHDSNVNRALSLIAPDAFVLTQYEIFPHVSSSLNSFVVPPPFEAFKRDYYYSYVQSLFYKNFDFVVVDVNSDTKTYGLDFTSLMIFTELERKEDYGLYASIDGVLIYKRAYQGEPIAFEPFTLVRKYFDMPIIEEGTIFKHPLPAGTYNITCRVLLDHKINDIFFTFEIRQENDVLTSRDVYGEEVTTVQDYQGFHFPLTVLDQTREVEFRISNLTRLANIYLDSLEISQTNYSSS